MEEYEMKLYSVLVGINIYEDKRINNIRFACADAMRFNRLIQASILEDERHTFLLTDKEATRSNILGVLGVQVASLAMWDDLVFIHFSCHGSPEIGLGKRVDEASRYLVPHDARYDNIFGTGIDMEHDLKRILGRIQAHLIFMSIDTCFSGMAGGRTFEGPNLQQLRSRFRSLVSLQTLDLGEGRVVITAADDDQVSLEDEQLGHGILSYALFEVLTDAQTAENRISITTLYDRVAKRVYELSAGNQSPILNGRSRLAKFPKFLEDQP